MGIKSQTERHTNTQSTEKEKIMFENYFYNVLDIFKQEKAKNTLKIFSSEFNNSGCTK